MKPGDTVVDATVGNGHDLLFLAKTALNPSEGTIYGFDIQKEALEHSQARIESELPALRERVHLFLQSHEAFPEFFSELEIKLFVYNLGYLPGANKETTTLLESTLKSVEHACKLVMPGGAISITCYPGHPQGAIEEEALLEFAKGLDKAEWSACHQRWLNRERSPSLLLLQKNSVLNGV